MWTVCSATCEKRWHSVGEGRMVKSIGGEVDGGEIAY